MTYNEQNKQNHCNQCNQHNSLNITSIFNSEYSSYLYNSIYTFLIYTLLYYCYEFINFESKASDKIISFLIYFFLLIISQGAMNLSLANSVCDSFQYTRAVSITMFYWLFCYGLIYYGFYILQNSFVPFTVNNTHNIAFVVFALVFGIYMSILSYSYILNSECSTSVEDLQNEYINYLNKLNNKTNVVSQRIYYEEKSPSSPSDVSF